MLKRQERIPSSSSPESAQSATIWVCCLVTIVSICPISIGLCPVTSVYMSISISLCPVSIYKFSCFTCSKSRKKSSTDENSARLRMLKWTEYKNKRVRRHFWVKMEDFFQIWWIHNILASWIRIRKIFLISEWVIGFIDKNKWQKITIIWKFFFWVKKQ